MPDLVFQKTLTNYHLLKFCDAAAMLESCLRGAAAVHRFG